MTNNTTESLALILTNAINDYDTNRDNETRDYADDSTMHPFRRFAFSFTRAASADLAESLKFSTPRISPYTNELFSDKYYFSDSTFDEISNPLAACDDAQFLISILYECSPAEFPNFDDLMTTITDDIDMMIELDELPTMTSLDDITAAIDSTYNFTPTDS